MVAFVLLLVIKELPEHDEGGLFTLLDLCADAVPLRVSGLERAVIALVNGDGPEVENIHATITFLSGGVGGYAAGLMPGHGPLSHARFNGLNNLVSDALVNVDTFGHGVCSSNGGEGVAKHLSRPSPARVGGSGVKDSEAAGFFEGAL